jgi:hypothetical protein
MVLLQLDMPKKVKLSLRRIQLKKVEEEALCKDAAACTKFSLKDIVAW